MKHETISIRGAREHNLKNISLELPRERLIIVTGVSGSGKSSLAFDTIFAEGQRRFLESLDAYARKFAHKLKKPAVDFVQGLSPVISIQQKTTNQNPRSTVGTLTDIYDYLRLLYTTAGVGHCLCCDAPLVTQSPAQALERLLTYPEGTALEIVVPFLKLYGEDWNTLLGEIRGKKIRRLYINGEPYDLAETIELDEGRDYFIEGIVDKIVVKKVMRDQEKSILLSLQNAIRIGQGLVRFQESLASQYPTPDTQSPTCRLGYFLGEPEPVNFSFNEPVSWCETCTGLGYTRKVHPGLLIPDPTRSILGGAFVEAAFSYQKNNWATRLLWSLAQHYGFSLETPWKDLPASVQNRILYGSGGEKFPIVLPPNATEGERYVGQLWRYEGIITDIERRYRNYRKNKVADTWMEEYLKKVMVETVCPDCNGAKLVKQRLAIRVGGVSIHEMSTTPLEDLIPFLESITVTGRQHEAAEQIKHEIILRVDLLVKIGLDYLSLSRRAGTLSGGESQRTRLSTQISSGLMGMMYVLDEPSIGLHPKDNEKLIGTLKRLRDIGNTVIVVEHDEDTIRQADFIVEMGRGPGKHGGEVVVAGTLEEVSAHPTSLTGQFLSGRRKIERIAPPRPLTGQKLTVRGARHNNLKDIDVEIPLGVMVCVTGASGSGKSSLVNDILHKELVHRMHDSRILSGTHTDLEGVEHLRDVISIDQSPLGRSPRSNPATYIGFYDEIRALFAATEMAQARGYTPAQFSFNVRGGRCEECSGEGLLTTNLFFMPEVETLCTACNGTRYNAETLEIKWQGKTISDVLEMSIEEATPFFAERKGIARKLEILTQLGLGYLTLGQSATTLSGGEAQRVKLASELGKLKRGGRNLYILDEPTTGLHLADIQRLLESLDRLVEAGNTVLIIEHHLDVIACADWVIDLGPEGGRRGGEIVATGTPEQIAACAASHTGRFLRRGLGSRE